MADKVKMQDVQDEIKQVAETSLKFAESKRDEYLATLNERVDTVARKIEDMKGRAAEAGEAARADMRDAIRSLESRHAAIRDEIAAVRDTAPDAFADLKQGLDTALAELQDAYDQAKSRFE